MVAGIALDTAVGAEAASVTSQFAGPTQLEAASSCFRRQRHAKVNNADSCWAIQKEHTELVLQRSEEVQAE